MSVGDDFYGGIMAALGVVYMADYESIAEEIVRSCDGNKLLRCAKKEDDPWLPQLKVTMKTLRRRAKIGIPP